MMDMTEPRQTTGETADFKQQRMQMRDSILRRKRGLSDGYAGRGAGDGRQVLAGVTDVTAQMV